MAQITRNDARKDVPFWGPHDGRQHLGSQIPQKPFKKGAWSDNPNQVGKKNKNFNIFKSE